MPERDPSRPSLHLAVGRVARGVRHARRMRWRASQVGTGAVGSTGGGGSEPMGGGGSEPMGGGGAGGGPGGGPPPVPVTWPDSLTKRCSNGTTVLEECPGPSEPFFGQDGNYEIAVPSYTKRNGAVKDSVTGHIWEKVTENGTFMLAGAQQHCETLSAPGSSAASRTWRLPTRREARLHPGFRPYHGVSRHLRRPARTASTGPRPTSPRTARTPGACSPAMRRSASSRRTTRPAPGAVHRRREGDRAGRSLARRGLGARWLDGAPPAAPRLHRPGSSGATPSRTARSSTLAGEERLAAAEREGAALDRR